MEKNWVIFSLLDNPTLNANYKWQSCLLESSFDFDMHMKILIILKVPFLILRIILDLMLVLALVNYFGNLSWWQNRLYYFLKTDLFWSIDTVILFHKTATILQPDIFFDRLIDGFFLPQGYLRIQKKRLWNKRMRN